MKKLLVSGLLVLVCGLIVIGTPGVAEAAIPGRGTWLGYFYGRLDNGGDDLFVNGISVSNINSFVDFYRVRLNSPDPVLNAPAAFTILTMLGAPANTPWTQARTRFAEWEGIVRWYDANGRVQYNIYHRYSSNTYRQDDVPSDVAWYADSDMRLSIVFQNLDWSTYAIKRDCANPVGTMTPLQIPVPPPPPPPPPPPLVVECDALAPIPSSPEVNTTITLSARIRFTGTGGATTFTPSAQSLTVTGPSGTQGVAGLSVSPGSYGTGPGVRYFTLSGTYTPTQAGTYTVNWALRINGVTHTPNPCGGNTFMAMQHPFMTVSGGDVAAGASFRNSSGAACGIHKPDAGISGWNSNTGPAYNGAGTQYGAFAMSLIQGFVTNKGNAKPPSSLSFANTGSVGGGNYGGYFNDGPCIDYWANRPAAASPLPSNNFSLDNSQFNGGGIFSSGSGGNFTITGGSIDPGQKLTIYVDGDVYISGNIVYGGTGGWANTASIPSLTLIVFGVIHIGQGVTQLDGTYVAIPETSGPNNYATASNNYASPIPGTISTCSNGFSVRNPVAAPAAMLTNCTGAQPLTVNGSLIANQIFFLRTRGSVSNNTPAEVINYGPEHWLMPSQSITVDPNYQSIVSMPPIL